MLLSLQGVVAGYGATSVLNDIDLDLDTCELISLVGANGAGKSTIVKAISGLVRPTAGSIFLDGEDIVDLTTAERISRGIVHIPEGRQVLWRHVCVPVCLDVSPSPDQRGQ
jgi:branched-chain amino acid transport system ATP-binding protein